MMKTTIWTPPKPLEAEPFTGSRAVDSDQPNENAFHQLAARIDTGYGDDTVERALTVFHTGFSDAQPVMGRVRFPVAMPWRAGRPLPPVRVRHFVSGSDCRATITTPVFSLPHEETGSRGFLRFDLLWESAPVLPEGWDTYIASYSSETAYSASDKPESADADQSLYVIVEALRSPGDLPPQYPVAAVSD